MRRRRNALLTLLLALGVPALVFALIEGVLAAAGVQPLSEDPRYLEAAEQRHCRFGYGVATRFWCTFPGTELRDRVILTLGGSSVAGYPAGSPAFSEHLQGMLDRDHPGEYQVVKFGRACKDSIYVRRCLERAIFAEPEFVVVYAGHNDFGNWGFQSPSLRILLEEYGQIYTLGRWTSHLRLYSVLARAWGVPEEGLGAKSARWFTPEQLAASSEVILEEFTQNIRRVIELADDHGAQVLLVTVVSNLHEFPIRKESWDLVGLDWEEPSPDQRRWQEAYMRGIERFRAGDADAALEAFVVAQDLHPRGRARSALNERIRELARTAPHVHLVDFERMLHRSAAEEGIGCNYFGDDQYCDQFHPNQHAQRLIAQALLRRIEALSRTGASTTRPRSAGSSSP